MSIKYHTYHFLANTSFFFLILEGKKISLILLRLRLHFLLPRAIFQRKHLLFCDNVSKELIIDKVLTLKVSPLHKLGAAMLGRPAVSSSGPS